MGAVVLAGLAGLALAGAATFANAATWVPASDDEIVETLPAVAGWSQQERRLRRELVQRPRDPGVALEAAQSYLDLARSQGDARYAGYALGVLQAWQPMSAATPNDILVMHATVAQFLHDFDGAERTLKLALAAQPADAQGWLTLATILRVRGRYAESDAACNALVRLRQNLYAVACLAENAGLRGDHQAARDALQNALSSPALQDPRQAATRQWLWTTVAEVEELAGRSSAAASAYQQALAAQRAGYDTIAYSDFLLAENRPAEVLPLLAREPRSDAVLLRLAIATQRLQDAGKLPAARRDSARRDTEELAARFEAAALRPGMTSVHGREHALFALDVQKNPQQALVLARLNVQLQREPIDMLVFARAAAAANDADARREVRVLMQQTGLKDARIDALL
jgi:tetratricopeptide (TPR) repeat protein